MLIKEACIVALFIAMTVFIFAGAVGSAMAGELEIREEKAQAIVQIKENECGVEKNKRVGKKLDYAAILIMHNELDEAREVLQMVHDKADSEGCQMAVADYLKGEN